jgi:hypothetical protein
LELLARLQPVAERAVVLLRAHLHISEESDQLSEDYLYLLEENFEAGSALLNDQIVAPNGLSRLAFAALTDFLTASRAQEEGRLEKYVRVVDLLTRYLDVHGETAAAVMAKATLTLVEAIGREKYAFSAAEAQEMLLLELGLRIINVGGPTVWFVCGTLVWPCHWRARKEVFRELKVAPLSDGDVESLVKTLCNNAHVVNPRLAMMYLTSLRPDGRKVAWDEAVRSYLYHSDPSREPFAGALLAYWERLPVERRSLVSAAVMDRLSEGSSLEEATDPRGPAGVRWRAELKSSRGVDANVTWSGE